MPDATDEKEIRWVGSSCADLLAFPKTPRKEAGFQLGKVQAGIEPSDWKPFDEVGAGTREIRVSDTGQGIDRNSMQHIFDPFFTEFDVSRHSSGQYEFGRRGIGLGLTLVKGFVELHGGKVEAASEPGKGSTFTVRLPADKEGTPREAYSI